MNLFKDVKHLQHIVNNTGNFDFQCHDHHSELNITARIVNCPVHGSDVRHHENDSHMHITQTLKTVSGRCNRQLETFYVFSTKTVDVLSRQLISPYSCIIYEVDQDIPSFCNVINMTEIYTLKRYALFTRHLCQLIH